MSKKILITGGSGLVGRHMQDILPEAVYISSTDYNLTDPIAVHNMIETHMPDTVIHLAARVGGLLDNMKYQVEYLEENIQMNTNILNKCHEFNVDKVKLAIKINKRFLEKYKYEYLTTRKDSKPNYKLINQITN
jgi:GDP-L-fucose synthase